jgi:hypothetical protein
LRIVSRSSWTVRFCRSLKQPHFHVKYVYHVSHVASRSSRVLHAVRG